MIYLPPYTPSYDICLGGQGPCHQFVCGHMCISWLTTPEHKPHHFTTVLFLCIAMTQTDCNAVLMQKRCHLWEEELLFQLNYLTWLEKSSDSNLAFNYPLLISRQPLCCWKVTPYLTPAEWNPVAKIMKHLVLYINNKLGAWQTTLQLNL